MFTTGFKFFFGMGVALATAAVVYGYTSGGNHMGPVSLGWKGGVGEHVGYGVLISLGFVSMVIGCTVVALRDADASAQAQVAGVDHIAPTQPVTPSFWPVVGAFGVGTMAVGLVLNTAIFITGLVICALVAVEWVIDAWSDRATGDPEANRALRNRIMAPIEIPAAGAAFAAVGVLAVSRILLNASVLGAVVIAGVLSVLIMALGILAVAGRGLNRNVIAGLALLIGVVVIGGGVWATVAGEREFEHIEDELQEHQEEVVDQQVDEDNQETDDRTDEENERE